MRLLLPFSLLFSIVVNVNAQTEDPDFKNGILFGLEDSYPVKSIDSIFATSSLDSVAQWIVDTLTDQQYYLIGDWESQRYTTSWYLAKESTTGLVLYPIYYDVAFDHLQFNEDSTFVADVNCDGFDELFIHHESYLGHTGWEHAIHERWGGITIIDIKNRKELLQLDTYYTREEWWTTFAEDTSETLSYEEREVIDSGGDFECDFFKVWILKNEIRVQYQLESCKNDDYKHDPTLDFDQNKIPIYTYRLTETGFKLTP